MYLPDGHTAMSTIWPYFILDVVIPETLIDHLQSITPEQLVLSGALNINPSFSEEVCQPTPLGRIQLDHTKPALTPGLKVKLINAPSLLCPQTYNRCNVWVDNVSMRVSRPDISPCLPGT